MVFLRKSKKRMSRKNMSRKNMGRKNIHRGGQDDSNDSPWAANPEKSEVMFLRRFQEKAKELDQPIDNYTNEELKEVFKNDASELNTFRETVLVIGKSQQADKTKNADLNGIWKFIIKMYFTVAVDSIIDSFDEMEPAEVYDTLIKMQNESESKQSTKSDQLDAKIYRKLLVRMMEEGAELDWSFPEDRDNIPDDWKRRTLKITKRARNHFVNEDDDLIPLIYCALNSDEYQKSIDQLIKMDEEGDIVFKDVIKDVLSKSLTSGGNRRKRISRRRRPLFSFGKKEEAKPKEPEVFKGEFGNCNTYLQCLADGTSRGCNENLDYGLLPIYKRGDAPTKPLYNQACRKYKFYNSVPEEPFDRWARVGAKKMRSYLEEETCDLECEPYLKADTLNWNYLNGDERRRTMYPPKEK
jgi:hypothetical protein